MKEELITSGRVLRLERERFEYYFIFIFFIKVYKKNL